MAKRKKPGSGTQARRPPAKAAKRAKTKAVASSATEALAFPDPPSLPSGGRAVKCSRCGGSPDVLDWASLDSAGNPSCGCCKRCWSAYLLYYFSDQQSWEDWVTMLKDPQEEAKAEMATSIIVDKLPAPFNIEEVTGNEGYCLTVTRPLVAIARSEFKEITGLDPSEAGITEADLKDETGSGFKGVLMQHPGKPWLEYNLSFSMGLKRDTLHLDRAQHGFQEAGETVFTAQHSQFDTGAIITKCRNCVLTPKIADEQIGKSIFANWCGGSVSGSSSSAEVPKVAAATTTPGVKSSILGIQKSSAPAAMSSAASECGSALSASPRKGFEVASLGVPPSALAGTASLKRGKSTANLSAGSPSSMKGLPTGDKIDVAAYKFCLTCSSYIFVYIMLPKLLFLSYSF